MKPTIGRTVHVVLRDKRGELITRPGIIVRVWAGSTGVNAQVFTDDSNDGLPGVLWKTSLVYDEAGLLESSWHWPPRE